MCCDLSLVTSRGCGGIAVPDAGSQVVEMLSVLRLWWCDCVTVAYWWHTPLRELFFWFSSRQEENLMLKIPPSLCRPAWLVRCHPMSKMNQNDLFGFFGHDFPSLAYFRPAWNRWLKMHLQAGHGVTVLVMVHVSKMFRNVSNSVDILKLHAIFISICFMLVHSFLPWLSLNTPV